MYATLPVSCYAVATNLGNLEASFQFIVFQRFEVGGVDNNDREVLQEGETESVSVRETERGGFRSWGWLGAAWGLRLECFVTL